MDDFLNNVPEQASEDAVSDVELDIVSIEDLSHLNLRIPDYQRPYTWGKNSVNVLFNDIKEAIGDNENPRKDEYRLGSVILHKDNNEYNIVDGQQRLTTLAILLHCLSKEYKSNLLNIEFNSLSENTIRRNLTFLKGRVNGLSKTKTKEDSKNNVTPEDLKKYILNNCTVVKIVTSNLQEAFQFFDSQNTRGKKLAPHDLLKAYHLREKGKDVPLRKVVKLVNTWEDTNKKDDLKNLFEYYLYPIVMWSKEKYGLYYSIKNIDTFKGVSSKQVKDYSYAAYHKASNQFFEEFNHKNIHQTKLIRNKKLLTPPATRSIGSVTRLLDYFMRWSKVFPTDKDLSQFQLTQPIIAGLDFFEFTMHYQKLLADVQEKIKKFNNVKGEIPNTGAGDRYVKRLYECVLMAIADRFDLSALSNEIMTLSYAWCYMLRLTMTAVRLESINNYALGNKVKDNVAIPLFEAISELKRPEDLVQVLDIVTVLSPFKDDNFKGKQDSKKEKYKYLAVYNKLKNEYDELNKTS